MGTRRWLLQLQLLLAVAAGFDSACKNASGNYANVIVNCNSGVCDTLKQTAATAHANEALLPHLPAGTENIMHRSVESCAFDGEVVVAAPLSLRHTDLHHGIALEMMDSMILFADYVNSPDRSAGTRRGL